MITSKARCEGSCTANSATGIGLCAADMIAVWSWISPPVYLVLELSHHDYQQLIVHSEVIHSRASFIAAGMWSMVNAALYLVWTALYIVWTALYIVWTVMSKIYEVQRLHANPGQRKRNRHGAQAVWNHPLFELWLRSCRLWCIQLIGTSNQRGSGSLWSNSSAHKWLASYKCSWNWT